MNVSDIISGVACVVAIVALWRSGRVRVLDLRTQVRRDAAALKVEVAALREAIPAAVKSRRAVASARGYLRSGATVRFEAECEADGRKLDDLAQSIAQVESMPGLVTYTMAEELAARLHALRAHFTHLRDKYAAAALADDKDREFIREEMLSRVRAQTRD